METRSFNSALPNLAKVQIFPMWHLDPVSLIKKMLETYNDYSTKCNLKSPTQMGKGLEEPEELVKSGRQWCVL